MLFPVKLVTPINALSAKYGDKVEAEVSHDVPLPPSYASYLPAGSIAEGELVSAKPYTYNNYAGKDSFTVKFFAFRTPDGRIIPIEGHFLGGLNTWRAITIQPSVAECCGNSTVLKNNSIVSVHVQPSKGDIVGGWRGLRSEEMYDIRFPRLVFSRKHPALIVGSGEPMLLQLDSTTTIAVGAQSM